MQFGGARTETHQVVKTGRTPRPTRAKVEKPTRDKGEIVPPLRTLQLVSVMGVTRASKELGVSMTTLHKARKNGYVSKVIEVASDGVLRAIGAEPAMHTHIAPPPAPHGMGGFTPDEKRAIAGILAKLVA